MARWAADCKFIPSGAVVHLVLPVASWTWCVPNEEDGSDDGYESEAPAQCPQLIEDYQKCVYTNSANQAHLVAEKVQALAQQKVRISLSLCVWLFLSVCMCV